jgi:hypothetical protein
VGEKASEQGRESLKKEIPTKELLLQLASWHHLYNPTGFGITT